MSDFGSIGDAGIINLDADNISILNSGEINTNSTAFGNAGDININAHNLNILQNFDEAPQAAIFSQVTGEGSGASGNIAINARDSLTLQGGRIGVDSSAIVAGDEAAPDPGTILINTDQLILSQNSTISSRSTGNVAAGKIEIIANDSMNIEDSQISTSAETANAGDISIGTQDFFMRNALVTTSANTSGNGGDIEISSDFILMETGFIQGNTGGADFSGGNVAINSDFLIVSNQNLRTGGDTREQFIPNSGINVIQAAAPDGVSGDVNIGGLEFDISGELVDIGGEVLSLDGLQNNPCNVSSGSSLSNAGKGGLVIQPDGINSPTLSKPEFDKRLPVTVTSNQNQQHTKMADVTRQPDELAYLRCHWQALQNNLIQEGT